MTGVRETTDPIPRRHVLLFGVIAFGVAWATAGVLAATGGLVESPRVVGPLTLAGLLLPTTYMFAPAIATVTTRLLTGEDVIDAWLSLELRPGWRYLAVAWVGPAVLTLLGAGLYFLAFPAQFDPTLSAIRGALGGTGLDLPPVAIVALQLVAALTIGPLINSAFTIGEELGWRGFLLPKLLPLGPRRAVLAVGVVWGVWHWPLIAMGYNYGFEYTGFPWTGLLAMTWFTVLAGTFLGWVTLRTASVWPAVVGHAAINAVAGLGLLFLARQPTILLGPHPLGVLGGLPWVVLAVYLLVRDRFDPVERR